MRGRQQICILGWNIGHSSQAIHSGRRTASGSRLLETYDASKLVLDLDAADSPYVRRYEDEQQEQTTQSFVATRDGVKAREVAERRRGARMIPDLYRPNAVDYMRYALAGDTWKYSSTRNVFLRQVMVKCGIPGAGNFKDHIQWLRAYEALPSKVEQLLHANQNIPQYIQSAFRGCKSIYEISRITALMTQTLDGCEFVSSNGAFILHTIGVQVPEQYLRSWYTLKYVNAVIQKLETMGVDPGPHWYAAGLYYAAMLSSCQALKRYIDVAMTRNDKVGRIDIEQLRAAMNQVIVNWPHKRAGRRERFSDNEESRRGDLLRILTGWENRGVPEGDEERKPCFALLLQDDRTSFKGYIENLAKLEENGALWYEFTHVDLTRVRDCISNLGESGSLERASLFAGAFIRARNPLQALRVLKKHKQGQDSDSAQLLVQAPSPTDQIPLEGRNHTPSTSILSIPGLAPNLQMEIREALAMKYLMTEVADVDKGSLFKGLKKLGLYTPKNMSDIISILSAHWTRARDEQVRGWIRNHGPNNPAVRMAATCIDRRLTVVGEEWETRDDSNWYIREDIERLKSLQEDLNKPVPWTEAEDDLLQKLVSNSWQEGAEERTLKEWNDMAEEMAKTTEILGIYVRYYSGDILMERYKSLAREAATAKGVTTAE